MDTKISEEGMATHSSIIAWRIPMENSLQRRLMGYSPWGHKESDMTQRLSTEINKSRFFLL